MNTKLKYIIIEHKGSEAAILFPSDLLHQDVAGTKKVKSAGFCVLDANGKWLVGGGSISLNCDPRPHDVNILNGLLCVDGRHMSINE